MKLTFDHSFFIADPFCEALLSISKPELLSSEAVVQFSVTFLPFTDELNDESSTGNGMSQKTKAVSIVPETFAITVSLPAEFPIKQILAKPLLSETELPEPGLAPFTIKLIVTPDIGNSYWLFTSELKQTSLPGLAISNVSLGEMVSILTLSAEPKNPLTEGSFPVTISLIPSPLISPLDKIFAPSFIVTGIVPIPETDPK